jgi:hypothetical protein
MLDYHASQAAGLHGLAPSPGSALLLAMVSHGDDRAELPLLWRLCAQWVELGYAVTVLDGTTFESADNPGLAQLLDLDYPGGCENLCEPTWTIIPSAAGLQTLCEMPDGRSRSLQRLEALFQQEGIVIVYSRSDWLVQLLGDSGVAPLLAVSCARNSLLSSYLALKRLLIKGRLEPTIVHVAHGAGSTELSRSGAVALNLTECARNFLDFEVKSTSIALANPEIQGEEVAHLARRLLEGALPLAFQNAALEPTRRGAQGAGSH